MCGGQGALAALGSCSCCGKRCAVAWQPGAHLLPEWQGCGQVAAKVSCAAVRVPLSTAGGSGTEKSERKRGAGGSGAGFQGGRAKPGPAAASKRRKGPGGQAAAAEAPAGPAAQPSRMYAGEYDIAGSGLL